MSGGIRDIYYTGHQGAFGGRFPPDHSGGGINPRSADLHVYFFYFIYETSRSDEPVSGFYQTGRALIYQVRRCAIGRAATITLVRVMD